jgi:prepilin-type N-terminal cleavage/methylation domain-containing protein/prepilin-type processing-associated H-X9-DG protein
MSVFRHRPRRRAFTLIELLIVIAIVAVLVGLILPAVQRARESAARVKCANNLKQMGLACHMVEDIYNHLPTGGWGYRWVGDATRPSGPGQPGGWIFQILPFVEGDAVYNLAVSRAGVTRMVALPVPGFNCPSRRGGGPYQNIEPYFNYGGFGAPEVARSDYAANTGHQVADEIFGGPATLAQGDDPNYPWPSTSKFTGVIFQRSMIRLLAITNGTSNTFLAGEKYLNPHDYYTGRDPSDNENLYVGFDNDICRTTASPPLRDRAGYLNEYIFGSNHPSGVNMLYCDGSVHHISWDVDPGIFSRAGNRN